MADDNTFPDGAKLVDKPMLPKQPKKADAEANAAEQLRIARIGAPGYDDEGNPVDPDADPDDQGE